MTFAPQPPQRAFEQAGDCQFRHAGTHLPERLVERLARQQRRVPDRHDLDVVLGRTQSLHQFRGWGPAPGLARLREPPRVVHRHAVGLVPHRVEWPQRGELLEEAIPHAGALDFDPRHRPGFGPCLLVIPEVGHQQHVGSRDRHHGRRAREPRQVADVGA